MPPKFLLAPPPPISRLSYGPDPSDQYTTYVLYTYGIVYHKVISVMTFKVTL